MPNDDGNFLFSDDERRQFLQIEPEAEQFILPFISSREFLHGERRWCLWLRDANPTEIRRLREVERRINLVREYRLRSNRAATRGLAETLFLFGEIRQPANDFILIPRHFSEHRRYIAMGFLSNGNIAGDSCCVIEDATLYHFGVLSSSMHMAWVRQVCGRIKGDFRYSNTLVYNNFPWPQNMSTDHYRRVIERSGVILGIREEYHQNSLADSVLPYCNATEVVSWTQAIGSSC